MNQNPTFLFIDRDGVINDRLPGRYVESVSQFQFSEGTLEAMLILSKRFARIIVVTNQQGIGKGLMTEEDLAKVHAFMKSKIEEAGGRLDAIYFCPELKTLNPFNRKPNPGMGLQAKKDFPEINFSRSTMIGDSNSDMLFGKRLGMKTVFIETNPEEVKQASMIAIDQRFVSLMDYTKSLVKQNQ